MINDNTACVAQLAKVSDTQAVGHGFDPHLKTIKIGLNILFRSYLI